jgi:hypothetical protein
MFARAEKRELTPTFWMATAALVVAMAAFVVAVSGIATASPRVIVRKGDIAPGAVTAKALAKGAVTGPKIRKGTISTAKLDDESITAEKLATGSVTAPKLGGGSVTSQAIAASAVTSAAIAPGSIHGAALGTETVVSAPIANADTTAHNGEWTPSNTEKVACSPGEALLGTGFAMSTQGNAAASWLQALPVINGELHGVLGRISTDDGGVATGQVMAICLK